MPGLGLGGPSGLFEIPPYVVMLQYLDTSHAERMRLLDEMYKGKYPLGTEIDHGFSFWRVRVDYADGTEHFVVEPGDVVVWQEKAVWHFKAKDKSCTAYSRYKTAYRELGQPNNLPYIRPE